VNPYEGYVPNVPVGEKINFSSFEEVAGYEAIGREELRHAAFVLGNKFERNLKTSKKKKTRIVIYFGPFLCVFSCWWSW
jgi:hypothetical protein